MKKWLRKLRKDERGLTLVELLAVIVILAIVAAIAFVAIGNVIENSKKDAHVSNALQVIHAAKLYEAAGGEISAEGTSFKDLDTIEDLTNPWTKEEYEEEIITNAVVKNTNEGYVIDSFSADEGNCSINDVSEETLRKDGRKVCKSDDDS